MMVVITTPRSGDYVDEQSCAPRLGHLLAANGSGRRSSPGSDRQLLGKFVRLAFLFEILVDSRHR
jgi:hypothetical protein